MPPPTAPANSYSPPSVRSQAHHRRARRQRHQRRRCRTSAGPRVRLLDGNGNDLKHGGAALADLATIDISTMDPALRTSPSPPLRRDQPADRSPGASAVFGPQKGAPRPTSPLDAALAHFAQVIEAGSASL
ncbi:glycerate kinase [Bifidobacterium longum]|uniref:glycerate kinase n=1 Tax=Bifidobacterium longum TaxID=216816 RepID=UPI00214C689C|nr:glycerate kinase [Bifidobacterium longum]